MKTITSPDNALVKKALKLENPRNRDEHTRCLLNGCAHSRLRSMYFIAFYDETNSTLPPTYFSR